jgi:hypothetical protein
MKNRKQALFFLKTVAIVEEKDELAIESFLSRRNITIDWNEIKKAAGQTPVVFGRKISKKAQGIFNIF